MTRTGILFFALAIASAVNAHTVVIDGGKVHLRGELVNGGCAVAPDSQNMRVDMGQYRTNAFSGCSTAAWTFLVPWGSSFRALPLQKIRRFSWRHRGQVKPLSAAALGWHFSTNNNVRLSRTPRRSAGCPLIPESWRFISALATGRFPNTSCQAIFSRMSGLR